MSASPIAHPRSPFARLIVDDRGRLRTGPILGVVALGILVFAVGTFMALVVAGAGRPEALGVWVLAGFLLIKVPLLGVLWWILTRRREPPRAGGWHSEECGQILAYLEDQARSSLGRVDARARLAYFASEAWFVADAAADGDKADAVAVAMRIEGMAARARGAPPQAGEAGAGP